jgi:two-component system OmpR family response regulator
MIFSEHQRLWTDRRVAAATGKRRLLVVDDNMMGAAAVLAMLTQEGFDTQYASGGLSAIDLTRHWVPEIILLDINMPEHDGFQTAKIFRRLMTTSEAAIIAYTAQAEEDIHDRGISAGFDGYCQKGTSPEGLILLIGALMR